MPSIVKSILFAILAQGTQTTKHVQPPSPRGFPLLEAIFNDDLNNLKNLLINGDNPNRNFGVGSAMDYAHMYGKFNALKILKKYGGKSGKELGMVTPAMLYNPSN